MIRAENLASPFQVAFRGSGQTGLVDATFDKGGSGQGFRPHELLEAALASCMAMTLRKYAEQYDIDFSGIGVEVDLDRTDPVHPVFESELILPEKMPQTMRNRLLRVAQSCPVHRTLAAGFAFRTV